jgi:hypothetical protein
MKNKVLHVPFLELTELMCQVLEVTLNDKFNVTLNEDQRKELSEALDTTTDLEIVIECPDSKGGVATTPPTCIGIAYDGTSASDFLLKHKRDDYHFRTTKNVAWEITKPSMQVCMNIDIESMPDFPIDNKELSDSLKAAALKVLQRHLPTNLHNSVNYSASIRRK